MHPDNSQILNYLFISSNGVGGGMIKRMPCIYFRSLVEIFYILFTLKSMLLIPILLMRRP